MDSKNEPFSPEDGEYLELPGEWEEKARVLVEENIKTRSVLRNKSQCC